MKQISFTNTKIDAVFLAVKAQNKKILKVTKPIINIKKIFRDINFKIIKI